MPDPSKLAAALLLSLSSTASRAQTADTVFAKTGARSFSVFPTAIFKSPWAMTFLPAAGREASNKALVTEREGRLWLVDVAEGASQQVAGAPEVKVFEQGGLGDVVAHPDYARNQRIYLSYAEPGPNGTAGAAVGYGRLVMNETAPRVEQFKVIWRQQPKVDGGAHFSHRIAFSPDGHLFISSGDRFKFEPAQTLDTNLGKIVRLTAEGAPASGNPYARQGGVAAQIWTRATEACLASPSRPMAVCGNTKWARGAETRSTSSRRAATMAGRLSLMEISMMGVKCRAITGLADMRNQKSGGTLRSRQRG